AWFFCLPHFYFVSAEANERRKIPKRLDCEGFAGRVNAALARGIALNCETRQAKAIYGLNGKTRLARPMLLLAECRWCRIRCRRSGCSARWTRKKAYPSLTTPSHRLSSKGPMSCRGTAAGSSSVLLSARCLYQLVASF